MSNDILKEAIADAKAVRETALENAKIALEEAFKPRIQSMLSAKLKEVGDEEEEYPEDEFGDEEEFPGEEELPVPELKSYRDDDSAEDQFGGEEFPAELPVAGEVPAEEVPIDVGDEEGFGDEEGEEEFEEEGVIEINGVKYAPVVSEREISREEPVYEEEDLDNLDLEAVIKELESELDEEDDLEEGDNPYESPDQHKDWAEGGNGKPTEIHKKRKVR